MVSNPYIIGGVEMWQKMKAARERAGLTQQQVGDLCGSIKRESVAQWEQSKEKGGTRPSNEHFCKFLVVTETKPEELIEYDSSNKTFSKMPLVAPATQHNDILNQIAASIQITSDLVSRLKQPRVLPEEPMSQPGRQQVGEREFTTQDTKIISSGSHED